MLLLGTLDFFVGSFKLFFALLFKVLPTFFDTALQLIVVFFQLALLTLLIEPLMTGFSSEAYGSIYDYFFYSLEGPMLSGLKSLTWGNPTAFLFVSVVAILLGWISFRQSGALRIVRAIVLVTSLGLLIALPVNATLVSNGETVRFWRVSVATKSDSAPAQCDNDCILLRQSGNSCYVLDLRDNQVYAITSLNFSLSFHARESMRFHLLDVGPESEQIDGANHD